MSFKGISEWILCQDKAAKGGSAVALLTDDNALPAQKAGTYYSIIHAVLSLGLIMKKSYSRQLYHL